MKVTWNVSPVGYQLISKRCPSCHGAQNFTPSGAFRINSQKKVLDVWSIYKCVRCAWTWNISLFSRLPIGKINPQLYGQLVANAESAVQHYSHDLQVLRRNGATAQRYQVRLNSLLKSGGKSAFFALLALG